ASLQAGFCDPGDPLFARAKPAAHLDGGAVGRCIALRHDVRPVRHHVHPHEGERTGSPVYRDVHLAPRTDRGLARFLVGRGGARSMDRRREGLRVHRMSAVMNEITVLSRADVAALMTFGDYVEAVAEAFRLHTEGRAVLPPAMEIRGDGGAFHVKGARLGDYVAVKTNSNFPDNPNRGLPTIQGAILLFDAGGALLALVDSIEITIKRTGAATGVAARYLARPESAVATIIGCGAQGRVQLEALRHGLDIRRVFAVDNNPAAAAKFAAEIAALGLEAEVPA